MVGALKSTAIMPLLTILGTRFVIASAHTALCEADLNNADAGLSLLQTGSKRTPALAVNETEAGAARATLPKHLYELGLKVLKKEEILDAVVFNTRVEIRPSEGVNITFRIAIGDEVDGIEGYGLASLGDIKTDDNGMLNMVDIGGNLGRVSIAAFKLQPKKMRILVVEPAPITYFLLRWNLWLNKVPTLTQSELESSPTKPGVLALNSGVSSEDGQTVSFCYTPPWTMMSQICDCSVQKEQEVPQKWKTQCFPMVAHTVDYLLDVFGDQEIALLKMDCEGCENSAVPQLALRLQVPGLPRIHRFAGEFHESTNEIEEVACGFEQGRWFKHVCFVKGWGFKTVGLGERCPEGPHRASCNKLEQNISSQS